MKKLKVMTVVGTRPEIIRLSRVLDALDKSPSIEHISVHTGQNYDYQLNEIFYDDLNVRTPDFFLNAAASSSVVTIGQILINIDPLLDQVKPDAFLILGDTNSCLCAIPAKKRKIPIFHMEAGNRCFDMRVPEETNRRIVDHISDINLTYSDIAREYLLREGLPSDRIIKTGSPMFEVLSYYKSKIVRSKILNKLNLNPNKYFLVSAHRDENISSDRNFLNLVESLNRIAQVYKMPIIVSTHPRTRKKIEEIKDKLEFNDLIDWQRPMGFSDYVSLQMNSLVVLSDSGTISEESSILNFNALNLRETHERPEAMEEAQVILTGLNPDKILLSIEHLLSLDSKLKTNRIVNDYSMPNVSEKVVKIILSYTEYIKRIVWHEES